VTRVPFHLDEYLPDLDLPLAHERTIAPDLPPGSRWERMARIYEEVAAAVVDEAAAGWVPVVMSGDCTTSLGVVAGLQRAGREPSVVWFDGHGDLQTPETTTSGYIGGFPIRQLTGGSDRTVPDLLGLRPVREQDVVLVDARDLDPPEVEFLAGSPMLRVPVDRVRDVLPSGPVYLHVDVDVVDPGDLPGLLFPAAGGPALSAVTEAVRAVRDGCDVVAIGLACTYRPGSGSDRVLSDLAGVLTG
jgi:arginase